MYEERERETREKRKKQTNEKDKKESFSAVVSNSNVKKKNAVLRIIDSKLEIIYRGV